MTKQHLLPPHFFRILLTIALPIILQNLMQSLVNMLDTVMVGLDMIAIPGDTSAATISGIIADEMAIGMVNNKTTAVRIIPVPGKAAGDWAEFGGLLGGAPILPVSSFSCEEFIRRGGRIPAPIHSFRN